MNTDAFMGYRFSSVFIWSKTFVLSQRESSTWTTSIRPASKPASQ
jgi:hypothetical protein